MQGEVLFQKRFPEVNSHICVFNIVWSNPQTLFLIEPSLLILMYSWF